MLQPSRNGLEIGRMSTIAQQDILSHGMPMGPISQTIMWMDLSASMMAMPFNIHGWFLTMSVDYLAKWGAIRLPRIGSTSSLHNSMVDRYHHMPICRMNPIPSSHGSTILQVSLGKHKR